MTEPLSDGARLHHRPSDAQLRAALAALSPWRALAAPRFFGIEHVPTSGAVLLVGNHSIYGLLDPPLMVAEIYHRRGRFLRSLAEHAHYQLPGWWQFLQAGGAVRGTRDNCRAPVRGGRGGAGVSRRRAGGGEAQGRALPADLEAAHRLRPDGDRVGGADRPVRRGRHRGRLRRARRRRPPGVHPGAPGGRAARRPLGPGHAGGARARPDAAAPAGAAVLLVRGAGADRRVGRPGGRPGGAFRRPRRRPGLGLRADRRAAGRSRPPTRTGTCAPACGRDWPAG